MHTEGHDMGRDTADRSTPGDQFDDNSPGYETTDVNVKGVSVFLLGLFGFVFIFFFVCYGLGILINGLWVKEDGAPSQWAIGLGATPAGKGGNLTSNTEMQQKEYGRMVSNFPQPRLELDDGNQDTADLHAREDLLLEHYSTVDGQPGTIRIPIERAMELIAQRGLPVATQQKPSEMMAGDETTPIQAPLTTGFARTGFELTTIEAREQKMNYGKAMASENVQALPGK